MKILAIDVETSANNVDEFDLFNMRFSLEKLREPYRMLCFAAKFLDEEKMHFYSTFHHGVEKVVDQAHKLIDQADALLHYNGVSFDVPVLQREFLLAGKPPPAPTRQIDLYRVVKKHFRFPSRKLQHVATELGLAGKVKHTGYELWLRCAEGDPKAWALMRRYNIRDVRLLEELYDRLLPWITDHPHRGLYVEGEGSSCPNCMSVDLERRGFEILNAGKYQRYKCRACARWSRDTKRIEGVSIQGVK